MPNTTLDRFKTAMSRQFTSAPREGVNVYASDRGIETGTRVMQDQVRSMSSRRGLMGPAVFWRERIALINTTWLRGAVAGAVAQSLILAAPAIESGLAELSFRTKLASEADRTVSSKEIEGVTTKLASSPWQTGLDLMANQKNGTPAELLGEGLRSKVLLYSIAANEFDGAPLHDQALVNPTEERSGAARAACVVVMSGHMGTISRMSKESPISGSSFTLLQIARIADQAAHCVEASQEDHRSNLDVAALATRTPDLKSRLIDYHYSRNVEESRSQSFGLAFARYWSETQAPVHSEGAVQDVRDVLEASRTQVALTGLHHQGGIPEVQIDDLVVDRLKLLVEGASPTAVHAFDVKATLTLLDRTSQEQLEKEGALLSKEVWQTDAMATRTQPMLAMLVEQLPHIYGLLGIQPDYDRIRRSHEIVERAEIAHDKAKGVSLSMFQDHQGLSGQ